MATPTRWNFACPDWEARLRAGRSLVPDLPLDPVLADRAVGIFNNLRLPDVPGHPTFGEAGGEWSRDIVRATFGSLDSKGERQVRETFPMVPKKNNKTTTGAAIMLTALLENRRPNAEFMLVGPTQEVSDLAFAQAAGMIECDPENYLPKRFHVADHKKTIIDRRNGALLKVKTFDMKVVTGSRPAGVLLDELHIMSSYSYASRVVGQIRGGMVSIPEAFLIMITTQSDQPPAGVFKAELDYARGVRDGKITGGRMLPMIYEFPEKMQTAKGRPWNDPANWPMVMPNIGLSITIPRLIESRDEAAQKGEAEMRRWASQHLNLQIGLALHDERWRGADYWEAATDPSLGLGELLERSEVVCAGVDGGGMDDLLGFGVIGRERFTGRLLSWGRAWCDRAVLKLRQEIASTLEDFEANGDLILVDTRDEAIGGLCDVLDRIQAAGLLPRKYGIGLDVGGMPALQAGLAARGYLEPLVTAVAQGWALSGVINAMPGDMKDGKLVHADQPMTAWCVGNAKAELRGSNTFVTKQAAGTAKIDPLIAIFNAYKLMSLAPEAAGTNMAGYFEALAS